MPWELTVIKTDDSGERIPLQSKAEIQAAVELALPGGEWHDGGPSAQMIEILKTANFDPGTLKIMLRTRLTGAFEGDGYSLEFHGFEGDPLMEFYVDVRGDGDPLPALAVLCEKGKWSILDPNKSPIGLNAGKSESWEAFRTWRDRAIVIARRELR